jgi:hypothetical protein
VNAPVRASDLVWSSARDSIAEYESSPGKLRAFCRRCGSPIYARLVSAPDWLSIRLGLIDGDPGCRPRAHFNVSEKAPWYTITDELPQHAEDTEDT